MLQNLTDEDIVTNGHSVDGALSPDTCSTTTATPPSQVSDQTGQSVENVPSWYVIRATHGRAEKVCKALAEVLPNAETLCNCELYLPMVAKVQMERAEGDCPIKKVVKRPLDNGLLFVRCTLDQFCEIKNLTIAGLTPYYDHTNTNEYGRNPYLTVPDAQFQSFRTIIDSEMEDIITEQSNVPTLLKGDLVRVTEGPFAGVEGYVLRYKHQLRVFVRLECLGTYATAYVPKAYLEKVNHNISL